MICYIFYHTNMYMYILQLIWYLQCYRQKSSGNIQQESILVPSLQGGLSLEFERSDSTRSIRLVLYELLYIASQVQYTV